MRIIVESTDRVVSAWMGGDCVIERSLSGSLALFIIFPHE